MSINSIIPHLHIFTSARSRDSFVIFLSLTKFSFSKYSFLPFPQAGLFFKNIRIKKVLVILLPPPQAGPAASRLEAQASFPEGQESAWIKKTTWECFQNLFQLCTMIKMNRIMPMPMILQMILQIRQFRSRCMQRSSYISSRPHWGPSSNVCSGNCCSFCSFHQIADFTFRKLFFFLQKEEKLTFWEYNSLLIIYFTFGKLCAYQLFWEMRLLSPLMFVKEVSASADAASTDLMCLSTFRSPVQFLYLKLMPLPSFNVCLGHWDTINTDISQAQKVKKRFPIFCVRRNFDNFAAQVMGGVRWASESRTSV